MEGPERLGQRTRAVLQILIYGCSHEPGAVLHDGRDERPSGPSRLPALRCPQRLQVRIRFCVFGKARVQLEGAPEEFTGLA